MAASLILNLSSDALTHCQIQIADAAHLTAGFALRNKNQHRTSQWWAQFSMLRRHLRKLDADLQASITAAAMTIGGSSSLFTSKKRKRGSAITSGAKKKKISTSPQDALINRIEWLKNVAVPKTYLAFTQLAADNQYATLGLFLLGVLAQVHSAITTLVPNDDSDDGRSQGAGEARTTAVSDADEKGQGERGEGGETPLQDSTRFEHAPPLGTEDLGEVVSRVEKGRDLGSGSLEMAGDTVNPIRTSSKKHGKKAKGELASGPTVQKDVGKDKSKDAEPPEPNIKKEKKKRKKAKKGDEFDNLFSGLL